MIGEKSSYYINKSLLSDLSCQSFIANLLQQALGCSSVVYSNQLLGASHTWISYHYIILNLVNLDPV